MAGGREEPGALASGSWVNTLKPPGQILVTRLVVGPGANRQKTRKAIGIWNPGVGRDEQVSTSRPNYPVASDMRFVVQQQTQPYSDLPVPMAELIGQYTQLMRCWQFAKPAGMLSTICR